jgi:hypothetical protein
MGLLRTDRKGIRCPLLAQSEIDANPARLAPYSINITLYSDFLAHIGQIQIALELTGTLVYSRGA